MRPAAHPSAFSSLMASSANNRPATTERVSTSSQSLAETYALAVLSGCKGKLPESLIDDHYCPAVSNTGNMKLIQRNRGAPRLIVVQQAMRGVQEEMTNYLGADYGEHRRTDAQTSSDFAGSSDTGPYRTEPLLITGNKTRDAAMESPELEPEK